MILTIGIGSGRRCSRRLRLAAAQTLRHDSDSNIGRDLGVDCDAGVNSVYPVNLSYNNKL